MTRYHLVYNKNRICVSPCLILALWFSDDIWAPTHGIVWCFQWRSRGGKVPFSAGTVALSGFVLLGDRTHLHSSQGRGSACVWGGVIKWGWRSAVLFAVTQRCCSDWRVAEKPSLRRTGIIMMKWLTFHLSGTWADGVFRSPMALFKCQPVGGLLREDVNGCCRGRGKLDRCWCSSCPWSSFCLIIYHL